MIARHKHGWIGIDFGSKVAKIAQLERVGDRLRWRRAVIQRSHSTGNLTCTGDELQHALEVHGGFQGRLAACALPMSSTEMRAVAIPPGSNDERREMVAQELEATQGADDEPREFDFWQTGSGGTGEQEGLQEGVQVLSVATTRVAELTASLSAAGLECAVLDGLPCALARAVTMTAAKPADGPVAAIDWGHANATLSIVEHGRAQFTRLLRECGAGTLFHEVSQTLGLDETDAVELLTHFGLPGTDDADLETTEIREVIVDIVGMHVQRMLDELTRTFAFLRLQRQTLLPKRACLFGAGATVKNAAAFLSAKLETPCEVWRLAAGEEPETKTGGEEMFGPAAALSALAWK